MFSSDGYDDMLQERAQQAAQNNDNNKNSIQTCLPRRPRFKPIYIQCERDVLGQEELGASKMTSPAKKGNGEKKKMKKALCLHTQLY